MERVQVLLPEKHLIELPDDSPNTFKRSNIDCYMEKPSASFCNGKYSVLNHFCYVKFLAYYTLGSKSDKTCEYQLDELDDNLIENKHEECSYPPKTNVMISGKQCGVAEYDKSFNIVCEINFYLQTNLLPMRYFYFIRSEKDLLSGFPRMYRNKLQEEGV